MARQLQSCFNQEAETMPLRTLAQLIQQTFREWNENKVPRMGAAIAYYSVFSLAPLVLTAIGIASIVFGREAAQGAMSQELEGTIGPSAAQAIEELIKQTHQSGRGHGSRLRRHLDRSWFGCWGLCQLFSLIRLPA
jgi:uncharacterized BrkB/YihY/UPF0761 family membrane protein